MTMLTVINSVTFNYFYYDLYPDLDRPSKFGYARLSIQNKAEGRSFRDNPYFPLVYVPFLNLPEELIIGRHFLFQAKDVSPAYLSIGKREWKFTLVQPPRREQERLEIILNRLEEPLRQALKTSKRFQPGKDRSRVGVLGNFPAPLRDFLDEQTIYGNQRKARLEYTVMQEDLPSYRRYAALEETSSRNLGLPGLRVHTFNNGL